MVDRQKTLVVDGGAARIAELEAENERLERERDKWEQHACTGDDVLARTRVKLAAAESALASERAAHAETNKLLAGVRDDAMRADNELCAMEARIAELEAEVERLKHDGFLARVARYFDASELAGSFLSEDGDGGFLAAIHGMTKEIARLRAEALSRTGAVKVELSGNTGELIDKMAEAIRGDTTSNDTPWATLSEDRKIGWRGDAERALAVVEEYLTARRPAERAVTEAMVEAAVQAVRQYTHETLFIDEHRELVRAALKAALGAQTPPEGAVTEAQGWRDMASAPKDGTHFVAVEQWPSGNIYARVYEWVGEPDYWREVNRGGTCIRPDYQDRYKWMPLPAAPQPKGDA